MCPLPLPSATAPLSLALGLLWLRLPATMLGRWSQLRLSTPPCHTLDHLSVHAKYLKGTTEKSARSQAQIAHTSHSPRQDAFLRQRPADPEDVAINCQAYSLVPEATARLTGPSPDTC